ncbi:hypothetical protein F5Y12DRAFT_766005 [Xylaria sp. FL1777]|nr:hypothetical protein F5Y12DRAFT_766005 [Xylaria sp. FL1777]
MSNMATFWVKTDNDRSMLTRAREMLKAYFIRWKPSRYVSVVAHGGNSTQNRPVSPQIKPSPYVSVVAHGGNSTQKRPVSPQKQPPPYVSVVAHGGNSTQDGPVSPRRNPEGYPEIDKLARNVRTNYLRGGIVGGERFLPNDKLEELVTKESVLLALQETAIKQQNHEDLAAWVLESGKRLFLILVLLTRGPMEHLSRLEDLKNDGISDSALPLGFSETEPYYGHSLAAEAEGARKFSSFNSWEDNNLLLFTTFQWTFLAPVFGASSKFRYQLSREQPLPLLNLTKETPKSDIYGEIFHGEIHPTHIDSQRLSALGMNSPGVQGIPVSVKEIYPSDNLHLFFDINTGKFRTALPGISPGRIQPIAAYRKDERDFVIFQLDNGGKLHDKQSNARDATSLGNERLVK